MTLVALFAILFLAIGIGTRLSIKAMSPVPAKLGVFYGRLKPCLETSNCVSSQATSEAHRIEPILFVGVDRPTAYSLLSEVVEEMPRANILVSRVDYIHVEYSSLVFGFRDDTELWLDDNKGGSRCGRRRGWVRVIWE
ncbi:MAG: DUF1499 domain-containing protein [bacterium]|nr:DUF1499 domain-containing protein [bacterium]